jgi:hypothetical protein
MAARTKDYPADAPTRRELLAAVRDSTQQTIEWFKSAAKRSEDIVPAVKRLDEQIKRMEQAGLDRITVRMLGDVNQLRRGITRANIVARTEFMGPAYALFEFFLVFIFFCCSLAAFARRQAITRACMAGAVRPSRLSGRALSENESLRG